MRVVYRARNDYEESLVDGRAGRAWGVLHGGPHGGGAGRAAIDFPESTAGASDGAVSVRAEPGGAYDWSAVARRSERLCFQRQDDGGLFHRGYDCGFGFADVRDLVGDH